jgi:hypothetical protein
MTLQRTNISHRFSVFFCLSFSLASPCHAALQGATHPEQRFVTVAPNVRLEVLDWGGSGRNLVLLAGGGNTSHVFAMTLPAKNVSLSELI